MWVGYCVCGVNAWLWSSIFHTRDTLLTERMDYFAATLLSFAGTYCAAMRVFEVRAQPLQTDRER
jgi:post-GPI attachment to proteins factor 3